MEITNARAGLNVARLIAEVTIAGAQDSLNVISACEAAQTWLAELDQSITDGDLTQYRATCQVLKATLAGDQSPEVIQLFEEYMQCHSI